MEALLRWRHLAPTAPDTLPAIPLSEADPFILTASPAVFFVGCQPAYGTRLVTGAETSAGCCAMLCDVLVLLQSVLVIVAWLHVKPISHMNAFSPCGARTHTGPEGQKVRLIAVPEFRKTGTALLIDLETLEPQPLHFDACLL